MNSIWLRGFKWAVHNFYGTTQSWEDQFNHRKKSKLFLVLLKTRAFHTPLPVQKGSEELYEFSCISGRAGRQQEKILETACTTLRRVRVMCNQPKQKERKNKKKFYRETRSGHVGLSFDSYFCSFYASIENSRWNIMQRKYRSERSNENPTYNHER